MIITYDKIKQDILTHTLSKYDKYIAITRGGLAVCQLLAYKNNVKNIDVINISSYNNREQKQLNIANVPNIDENTLFIDDIYDTGETYKAVKRLVDILGYKLNFLVYADKSNQLEKEYQSIINVPKEWIIFPWDY